MAMAGPWIAEGWSALAGRVPDRAGQLLNAYLCKCVGGPGTPAPQPPLDRFPPESIQTPRACHSAT